MVIIEDNITATIIKGIKDISFKEESSISHILGFKSRVAKIELKLVVVNIVIVENLVVTKLLLKIKVN